MYTFSPREPKFPECECPKSGEKIQKIGSVEFLYRSTELKSTDALEEGTSAWYLKTVPVWCDMLGFSYRGVIAFGGATAVRVNPRERASFLTTFQQRKKTKNQILVVYHVAGYAQTVG